MGNADGCVEQPEVVIDLRDGTDGRTGTTAGGFLFNGDRWAKPFDGINVRALDLVKKLAGVGGKSFDVAALSFGVDSIEGQRRLTGAREAGDHGKGIPRNANADVAEIMLARSTDGDVSY